MMGRFGNLTIAILILCAAALTQEKVSPLSDYQYSKRDYPQYESIKKETDAQKKCDALIGFIKDHPISRMLIYAVTDYMDCVKPVLEKKDFAKAIAMEEGLQALLPTDNAIKEAGIPAGAEGPAGEEDFRKTHLQPAQALIEGKLLEAYYGANNYPKAAEILEKMYAASSSKSLIPALADIYLKMQNYDKYLANAKKILAESPIEKTYPTAMQMAQIYFQKQENSEALDLYSKIEAAFGDKTPPNVTEAQYNALRVMVYSNKAAELYKNKDYPKVQELSEKVIKLDAKNDAAYYYIARCKWQNNDYDGAMESFAKCAVLNKTVAKNCQKSLEDIYKARNPGSTDGPEKILAKAKSDLGIN